MEVTHFEKKIRDYFKINPPPLSVAKMIGKEIGRKFVKPGSIKFLLNISFSFQLHKGIILIILKKENERA